VSIPEEIKKSQQLLVQKDRMLAQTQEEANRTLALAREKADKVVEKDQIVTAAQARAEQIVAQSRLECEQIKRDADEYVLQTLQALKAEMEKSLNQINNGIVTIESSKKNPPQENQ
jgi:cell division septum initiation protein DivIVA